MSAYVVERDHISYLLDAAMHRRIAGLGSSTFRWWHNDESHQLSPGDYARAAEVGQMLWDENLKSYCYRYRESDGTPYQYGSHRGRPMINVEPVEVLKAAKCYEYQTCEHPEWGDSESFAFIESLKDHCISSLVGYSDAEWGPPISYTRQKVTA